MLRCGAAPCRGLSHRPPPQPVPAAGVSRWCGPLGWREAVSVLRQPSSHARAMAGVRESCHHEAITRPSRGHHEAITRAPPERGSKRNSSDGHQNIMRPHHLVTRQWQQLLLQRQAQRWQARRRQQVRWRQQMLPPRARQWQTGRRQRREL